MEEIPLDPNETIKNLNKMLNRLIGEDIFLTVDLASDLKMIKGDPGTIEQVIMNLVVNARDAMPGGGKIIIKTSNILFNEEDSKRYSDAKPGEFVCFSVHDTGDGIEPSILDRIFEPFFTTKAQGKGTGLGLSAVYGIVKKHGGWINVESTPDDETTFKIYLPAISVGSEQKRQPLVSQEEFKGNGERILLVEDEEVVMNLLTEMLTGKGYKVFSAANAKEAIDIFEKEKGTFDLVFSDVVLPDIRGPKLVKQLLKQKPKIRVLFTSGYSDEKSDWQTIQKLGYPYLQKPFTSYDMLKTVKEALEK
ncbi:MAG: response regulator [Deltaproteobacteria bacterium]|nr:response regulator [Deltaproteobacteria bacterium]